MKVFYSGSVEETSDKDDIRQVTLWLGHLYRRGESDFISIKSVSVLLSADGIFEVAPTWLKWKDRIRR